MSRPVKVKWLFNVRAGQRHRFKSHHSDLEKTKILSPTPTRVEAKIGKANETKVHAIKMLNHLDQKYQPEKNLTRMKLTTLV